MKDTGSEELKIEEIPNIEDKDRPIGAAPIALAPFDRSVDMKIWNRRWKVYWLWLEGNMTQADIAVMLDVDPWTINKDLAAIREQLRFVPEHLEARINEIYMRIVLARNEAMQAARNAELDHAKAKLYEVAQKWDKNLLDRFTIPGRKGADTTEDNKLLKQFFEYLGETYKAEGVEHYMDWVKRRTALENQLKPGAKTDHR